MMRRPDIEALPIRWIQDSACSSTGSSTHQTGTLLLNRGRAGCSGHTKNTLGIEGNSVLSWTLPRARAGLLAPSRVVWFTQGSLGRGQVHAA